MMESNEIIPVKALGTIEDVKKTFKILIEMGKRQNIKIELDYRFPTRLLNFVKDIQVNNQMGFEELEYMKIVAKELREQQEKQATDPDEIDYLNRTKK